MITDRDHYLKKAYFWLGVAHDDRTNRKQTELALRYVEVYLKFAEAFKETDNVRK